jgi:hypothetical protein
MLSNLSQYSPQGLLPQFPGLQAAGFPQVTPGPFGQPGGYNGNAQFGHEGHPSAFGGQPNPFQQNPFQPNPFAQNQFSPSPFAPNPYQLSPWSQNPGAHNPLQNSFGGPAGGNIPVQQIVPVLAQLAQQIAVQSAVAQQIGLAVHQLAQQLAAQAQQSHPGGGFGAGQAFAGPGQPFSGGAQPFGPGGPFLGTPGAQYFGPNSFSNTQGGYGGFSPQQAQAWGANRPQTIQ